MVSKLYKRHRSAAIFSVDDGSEMVKNEIAENFKKNIGILRCENNYIGTLVATGVNSNPSSEG